MKRTPLKRKKSLRDYSREKGARSGKTKVCAAEGCTETFYEYPSHPQRFCSRSCAYRSREPARQKDREAKSRKALGTRRGAANPNFRHGRRVGAHNRDRRRFQSLQRECQHQTCPDPGETKLCQHHVIYEQAVRRAAGDTYDPRNALALCWACHSSHHRGGRKIALVVLRDANFAFASELLGAAAAYEYLRRRYSGEDARLDALLTA